MPQLRHLLILGRVSNLPTVWSNCLAGWWLGGNGDVGKLPWVAGGTTCLYLGGMFLNDAFDADWDHDFRRERPIPSGAVSRATVWRWGLVWLLIGAALLARVGLGTGILGLALLACIVLYDAIHKVVTFSPVLMGLCRFLVYVIAASGAAGGMNGWAVWCGMALALYVMGLSFVARRESARGNVPYWALLFLAMPILLAIVMNADGFRGPALLLCLVLGLWVLRALRPTLWSPDPQVSRTVARLLAGIVFVDWVAVVGAPRSVSCIFMALFGLALLLQRFAPAT